MSETVTVALARLRAALAERTRSRKTIRWSTEREFLGLPLVDIAVGKVDGTHGHAKGVVAIGDKATGVIAFGILARGLCAFGIIAIGAFSVGWLALGAFAVGGLVGGLVAFGAGAVGVYAMGGAALGIVAVGAVAAGNYAAGFAAYGDHIFTRTVQDREVLDAIAGFWSWPFGR
jgi:hypothetical protein